MHFQAFLASSMALLPSVAAVPVEPVSIETANIDNLPVDFDSVSSNPESLLEKRMWHNQQSCVAKQNWQDWGLSLDYTIYVGVHYNKGTGCKSLEDGIGKAVGGWEADSWEYWHCESADKGATTELRFRAYTGYGAAINAFLHKAFPTVNGFNCPSK